MNNSQACVRCAKLGSSAVVAALSLSLASAPPPVHLGTFQIQKHLVRLQAATVSAVANSSVFEAFPPAAPLETAITEAAASNIAPAATTGDVADTLATLGHKIATAAGWALAPIWYLAFPITTTLWDFAIAPLFFPDYPKMLGIPFFMMFPTSWFVPFILDDILSSRFLSPVPSTSPAASRAAVTISPAADAPAAHTDVRVGEPQRQRTGRALRDNDSVRGSTKRGAPKSIGSRTQRSTKSAAAVRSPSDSKAEDKVPKKGSAARP